MSRTLENKVVLITGSGSGMGRSHAVLIAERGARVVVHDIDSDRVAETADLVRAAGFPPHAICVDMRDNRNARGKPSRRRSAPTGRSMCW